ncbi:hypothetical protein F4802DRAFT_592359 [Xylaria palmicola]|nr:hypothetical protein F4802DRAFT_592359 [Xylaria palmicola]
MDADGRVDLQHDAYCLRKHFTTRWGVLKDQSIMGAPRRLGDVVEWNDWQWTLKVEGEQCGLWVDLSQPNHLRRVPTKRTALIDFISSPLLVYRIITNFAAPPCTDVDRYGCAWSYIFWNQEDPTCWLQIYEHKAWPVAYFCGGKKASNEALQLLEWLSGENCSHSYDYTPCGRHA